MLDRIDSVALISPDIGEQIVAAAQLRGWRRYHECLTMPSSEPRRVPHCREHWRLLDREAEHVHSLCRKEWRFHRYQQPRARLRVPTADVAPATAVARLGSGVHVKAAAGRPGHAFGHGPGMYQQPSGSQSECTAIPKEGYFEPERGRYQLTKNG